MRHVKQYVIVIENETMARQTDFFKTEELLCKYRDLIILFVS